MRVDAETLPFPPPSRAQIRLYFADCVYTTADAVGFYFGLASIACWLVAQVPQFVQNFRLKSAEGLSPWFLAEWLMGDTFNLLGCLMTGDQLQTEVYTAVYFMCVDMLMIFQFVYYTLLRREALGLITADMRDPESALSRRPLLADAVDDDASDASDASDESDDDVATVAGSIPTDGFRVRPDPVDRLASPPPREPDRPRPRRRSPTRRPASPVAALAAASVAVLAVVAVVVVSSNPAASDEFRFSRLRRGGSPRPRSDAGRTAEATRAFEAPPFVNPEPSASVLISPERRSSHSPSPSPSPSPTNLPACGESFNPPWEVYLGRGVGYVSSVFYLGSRLSQIYKNQTRRSCEGLSMAMFAVAAAANTLYGAAILLRAGSWALVADSAPWLLGSLGTVALDTTILLQSRWFGDERVGDGDGDGDGGRGGWNGRGGRDGERAETEAESETEDESSRRASTATARPPTGG